jgi:1-aminocyclopropane-1-carboxylate deaminase/D-cysteine desulfhydrase-like pyridoxal-dependent ACC family enzyme
MQNINPQISSLEEQQGAQQIQLNLLEDKHKENFSKHAQDIHELMTEVHQLRDIVTDTDYKRYLGVIIRFHCAVFFPL